jgi:hypothetical protein
MNIFRGLTLATIRPRCQPLLSYLNETLMRAR